MEGRGEKITPLNPMPHQWVILIIPDVPGIPGKTKRLYNMLQPVSLHRRDIYRKLVTRFEIESSSFHTSVLFNTFENVVFTRGEELTDYRDHLLKLGAPNVHLAGSGPTLFILLEKKLRLKNCSAAARPEMEAYLTETRNS